MKIPFVLRVVALAFLLSGRLRNWLDANGWLTN